MSAIKESNVVRRLSSVDTLTDCCGDGIVLSDYRQWRMSMRGSMHAVILASNGNCEDFLDFEDEDKLFRRHYVILDIGKLCLELYRDKPPVKRQEGCHGTTPKHSVDIRYISMVTKVTHKAKKSFSFEICTPKRKFLFAANNEDAMSIWMTAITKAANSPSPRSATLPDNFHCKKSSSLEDVRSETLSFQTAIIGGVVVRTPNVKAQPSNIENFLLKRKASRSSTSTGGGLKILYQGWCWKQGNIMKNWKHRYFRLNAIKLSYYDSMEEGKEPIRSILNHEIKGVRILPKFCNRLMCLEVETPKRKFYMDPVDREEVNRWKEALQNVIEASGYFLPRTKSV